MKKNLVLAAKVVGALVGVCVLVVAGLLGYAFAGNPTPPVRADIGPGVTLVKDGYVCVFVLDAGPGQVALVDAGNDPKGAAILAELARRHLGPDAVRAIFLTHGHPDHTNGAPLFPRAQVMALAAEVAVVEGRERTRGPLPQLLPAKDVGVRISHPLQDGEQVQLGTLLVKVYALPGHTQGSAAYLANGVLFTGDGADATKDGKLVPAKWLFSDSVDQDVASLKSLAGRLAAEDVKVIAAAHTGILTRGLAPLTELAAAR